jgi:hypothetical protein
LIYIVLGMHKSGTTLVSQILHNSGINMGEFDEEISYDKGNKHERLSTLQLDMDILGTEKFDVLDLTPDGTLTLSDDHRQRMREIIQDCQDKFQDWGFKDPRAALIYHLWAREMPEHKIIVVYRDPAQVWPRFRWDGKRKYYTNFNRAYSYLHRWREHNVNILESLHTRSMDHIVLSYNDLMKGDEELNRLEKFVGRDLVDMRKPGLFRSKAKRDIFLRFADWLLAIRTGQSTKDTMALLDAART